MRKLCLISIFAVLACTRTTARFASGTISIDPAFVSGAAPGEIITFQASGGDGRYHFAFANGAAASGTDATLDDQGHYQAGSIGPAEDVIVVTDSSHDSATATVSIGPALQLSTSAQTIAPGEKISLIAAGGKPPYTFSSLSAPSGGAFVDAGTGVYAIGQTGGVTDVVAVSDANARKNTLSLAVGGALALVLASRRNDQQHHR